MKLPVLEALIEDNRVIDKRPGDHPGRYRLSAHALGGGGGALGGQGGGTGP
jgi:hypothetical protein